MADRFSAFPTELIRAILTNVVECNTDLLIPSRRAQAQDLLSITHVNSRLRLVALKDATLWSQVVYLNGIHEEFLQAILHRSASLPLALAFIEDDTLPYGPGLQSIVAQLPRLQYLHIDIPEQFEGGLAKLIISMAAPLLRHCVIRFHGDRNVCMNQGVRLFNGNAPVLESLDLLNCHLIPNHPSFDLVVFSIRYLGPDPVETDAHPSPFMSIRDFVEWQGHFRLTTGMILSNCIVPVESVVAVSLAEVQLPVLKSLLIGASPVVCEQLARILRYPDNCNVSLNILLPQGRPIFPDDVQGSVLAACLFVLPGEIFKRCWLVVRHESSSIRLLSKTGRFLALRFDFAFIEPGVPGVFKPVALCMQATNYVLSSIPGNFTLSAIGILFHALWSTLATRLAPTIAGVACLHLAFHHRETFLMVGLSTFLSTMPLVQIAIFETPGVWGDLKFLCIVFRNVFPELRTIGIRLRKDLITDAKFGLATFLKYRQCRGVSIKTVQFSLAASLTKSMGFARTDGIRAMLGDLTAGFPRDVAIEILDRKF
ncbi:hypothetical protein MD484_g7707, partial [Candolleomyces efflorescens]